MRKLRITKSDLNLDLEYLDDAIKEMREEMKESDERMEQ
jgi:hypothetical protein